jgi:hypothetical protein
VGGAKGVIDVDVTALRQLLGKLWGVLLLLGVPPGRRGQQQQVRSGCDNCRGQLPRWWSEESRRGSGGHGEGLCLMGEQEQEQSTIRGSLLQRVAAVERSRAVASGCGIRQ